MRPSFFDSLNLDGKGVRIGIIDAGFTNADSSFWFKHIFGENRVVATKDYISPEASDFYEPKTKADIHGHNVMGYLAGYNDTLQQKIGLATGAHFYLARTENGEKEHLVEEDDWVSAIEWMYEQGVELVNTSLGYSEFDDTSENHVLSDMNGRTTKITLAAQKAAEKGMMIVVSAGNMGSSKWRYITSPADARGVLTVGATRKVNKTRIYYSSLGVEFVDYIKPEVATYSDRGTSYSSPAVAGFMACLMQYDSTLTPIQLKDVITKSSHLYPYGNNYVGYGIPDAKKAIGIIDSTYDPKSFTWEQTTEKGKVEIIINEKVENDYVITFHKKSKIIVAKQEAARVEESKAKSAHIKATIKPTKTSIKVKRYKDVKYTTVQFGKYVVEVEWQEKPEKEKKK